MTAMRRRDLRPGFVITISAVSVLSCNGGTPTRNPPPPPPETAPNKNPPAPTTSPVPAVVESGSPAPSAAPTAATSGPPAPKRIDFSAYPNQLNPRDAKGRPVHFGGKTCYVERPDKNPKDAPPGMMVTEPTPCPPAMSDPAWKACEGGALSANPDSSECLCVRSGNPPPPAVLTTCPARSK
jgi:hypothetical protein